MSPLIFLKQLTMKKHHGRKYKIFTDRMSDRYAPMMRDRGDGQDLSEEVFKDIESSGRY